MARKKIQRINNDIKFVQTIKIFVLFIKLFIIIIYKLLLFIIY